MRFRSYRVSITAFLLAGGLALSGCSSESTNQSAPMAPGSSMVASKPMTGEAGYGSSSSSGSSTELYMEDTKFAFYEAENATMTSSDSKGELAAGSLINPVVNPEKIIKRAFANVETKDYSNFESEVSRVVKQYGGYFERSDSWLDPYKDLKSGSMSIRVPQDKYDMTMDFICDLALRVNNRSESAVNATSEYYDIESRMKAKEVEAERLLELIEKANKVEDLINLEARLSDVRTTIESYKSQLLNIDRLTSYSTIEISIQEVKDETPQNVDPDLGARMRNSFISTINGLVSLFETIVVFLAGAILPIGIIGISALIVFSVIRRRNKYNKNEEEKK